MPVGLNRTLFFLEQLQRSRWYRTIIRHRIAALVPCKETWSGQIGTLRVRVLVDRLAAIGVLLVKVRPRGNESIQQTLKRFKRLCQREGLTRDMKRHSYYEKPSERKRRQTRKMLRRIEKDELELRLS